MKLKRFDNINYTLRPDSYMALDGPLQQSQERARCQTTTHHHDYFAADRLEELTDAILLDV